MDKKIEKQKSNLSKFIIYAMLLFICIYGIYNLFFSSLAVPSIDKDKIRIGIVKRGPLDISVSGNGVITAKDPEWIIAKVSGQVIKSNFKAGDSIKKGEVLVELINEDLTSAYVKSESELSAAMADFAALKVSLQSQLISYQSDLQKAELDSQYANSYYEAVSALWTKDSQPISQIEYSKAKLKAEQMKGLVKTARNILASFRETEAAQTNAFEFRLKSYEENNTRLKNKTKDLKITASIDGVLQNLNLKAGQAVMAGDQIAQIINPQSKFVTLNIPAIQAYKLSTLQKVDLEIDRKSIHGIVHRIDPNIKGTTVDVDVYFDENLTRAKIGMFVNGTIYTQRIANTLFVEIPSQAVENGNMSVFVLSPGDEFANLVPISSGALSSNYLQIIEGLEEGDRVILSDMPILNSAEQVKLN